MTDDPANFWRFYLFAHAEKRLNAACVSNCELGVAIEDGGCADVVIKNAVAACTPDGGHFVPFDVRLGGDAGSLEAERRIAPGSALKLSVYPYDAPSCTQTFDVPAGPMTVEINRDSAGECTFTTR